MLHATQICTDSQEKEAAYERRDGTKDGRKRSG